MPWRFRRRREDLDEEIRSHLAMAERERIERGDAPEVARSAVRREFGNIPLIKDVTNDVSGYPRLDRLSGDVRHACRRIVHRPATSAAATLMLGLAIGIATAMFAITDALLVRPVPFREPDRLLWLYMGNAHGGSGMVSPGVARAWRESPMFESVEAAVPGTSVVDVDGGPTVAASASITPGLFTMLGVRAIRGRGFDADSGQYEPNAVLISELLWRTSLDADPNVVGRVVSVDGKPARVIGVMASDVRFPEWNTAVWLPLATGPSGEPAGRAMAFLRTAPGVQIADALNVATDRAHIADPSTAALRAVVNPLSGRRFGTYYRRAVGLLAVGVLLVFLVLSANVCSLLLARFTARRAEFTLCAVLGASRGRLMRQAIVESMLLASGGTVVGVGLAWALVRLAGSRLPEAFLSETLNPIDIDGRSLLAAAACAAMAATITGLIPAIMATRTASASSASLQDRTMTEGRVARVFTRTLLVGQVALACVLLAVASLLIRSFINILGVDRGFDPHGLVAVYVTLDGTQALDRQAQRAAILAAADGLRSVPGVERLALSGGGPMTDASNIHFGEWRTDLTGAAPVEMEVEESLVSPEFFDIYGIRLLKGRLLEVTDTSDVAVVGERIARLWPNGDAVGHTLAFLSGRWQVRIVGVVKETNRPSLDAGVDLADLFTPLSSNGVGPTITLRCGSNCPSEGIIRQRVREASAAAVFRVTRLDEAYVKDLAQPRVTAVVGTLFGVIALVASAAGLFSVLSAAVVRRRREFGIRAALGASPGQLRQSVLAEGMAVLAIGLVLGSVAAYALMELMSSLQYGVAASDPAGWAAVVLTLVGTTLAACWWPAREAMRTDPARLLRQD